MEQAKDKNQAIGKLQPARFDLTFNQKVTRDELIGVMDRILGLIGCAACGLNGFELHYHSERINPALDKVRTQLLENKKALVKVEVMDVNIPQF